MKIATSTACKAAGINPDSKSSVRIVPVSGQLTNAFGPLPPPHSPRCGSVPPVLARHGFKSHEAVHFLTAGYPSLPLGILPGCRLIERAEWIVLLGQFLKV